MINNLICPDDAQKLIMAEDKLECSYCGRIFAQENNTFYLLPKEYTEDKNSIEERNDSFNYWNGGIPGTVEGGYQKDDVSASFGSKDWFIEGDDFRYNHYQALEKFCEFKKYKDKKVLDIGPGRGQESHNYLKNGANLDVLEFATQGVEILSKRREVFDLEFNILQGDAAQIPLKDNMYDLVFSYGVLHHIPDIKRAIKEVERIVKPGGQVKLMLYHKGFFYYVIMFLQWYILKGNFFKYSWKEYIKIAMEQREGPCPVVYIYSMKEIYKLFDNTNLEITDYFNDEIIEGRLVNLGIIPKWFIEKYRNYLGAYCHITLKKGQL